MEEFIPGASVLCRAQPPLCLLETCLIKNTILLITLLPVNEPDPSIPDSTQSTPALPLDLRCTGKLPSPSSTWSAEHWDWGAEHQNLGAEPRNGSTRHEKGWKSVGEPLPWLQPKGPQAAGGGRGWEWGKEKIPTRFTEQTSQEQLLCRCLSVCTWQRHSPRAISSGHGQRSPCTAPSPARPPQSTAPCHRPSRVPKQCCPARGDTNGTGDTRTGPKKRFLTLV